MPIDTICGGCSKRLRVADQHAGKQARCPHCGSVYRVPQADATASQSAASPTAGSPSGGSSAGGSPSTGASPAGGSNAANNPGLGAAADAWKMRTEQGAIYGPVSKQELDDWVSQGRVSPNSHIQQSDGPWQRAANVYPALESSAAATADPFTGIGGSQYPAGGSQYPTGGSQYPAGGSQYPAGGSQYPAGGSQYPTGGNPYASSPGTNPYADAAPYGSATGMGGRRRFQQPHHGVIILVLSLVGLPLALFCPVFMVMAAVSVIWGIIDLGKMKNGEMDERGRGLTLAGVIIGGIQIVLALAVLVLIVIAAAMDM